MCNVSVAKQACWPGEGRTQRLPSSARFPSCTRLASREWTLRASASWLMWHADSGTASEGTQLGMVGTGVQREAVKEVCARGISAEGCIVSVDQQPELLREMQVLPSTTPHFKGYWVRKLQ